MKNETNKSNIASPQLAPQLHTPEQADQFLKFYWGEIELDKTQLELLADVQRQMGKLVYDELVFGVGNYLECHDDLEGAFKKTIAGMVSEIKGHPMDLSCDCGTLFAKLWEQFVRLHPQVEPWPEWTQATRWRSLEGSDTNT
jgi:hypothetical protein